MKKLLRLLPLLAAVLVYSSCDQNKFKEDDEDKDNGYYEFPLSYQEDGYVAGDNGVNINISSVDEDNIVFNLVPGASVQSYRLDVYPKAMLYNLLLNEGCLMTSQENCEEKIITLLTNSSGSSGYVFDKSMDDYSAKEFDWLNSEYSQARIVSDCEYFVLVLACYDSEGQNPASLNIAHVTTPSRELVGDPQIAVEAEVGYRAFVVKYHPNEDCRYFYHWIWTTEEISEYIDLFGEKMMRDFCRSAVYDPYDATLEENLSVKRTFDTANGITKENTAIAVALDANFTPSEYIFRNDFALLDIPEGDFEPKATIKPGSRIGATVAYFDITLERSAMSCFYRLYPVDKALALKEASENEKLVEAMSLATEGWGVANMNFSFNQDTEMLTGDTYTTSDESQVELIPETEYMVVYVAKNYFGELSELCFSSPFRTKRLIKDNPSACEADVTLELTNPSRWGFDYNFDYNYDKTACYRFQIVYPYQEDAEITPPHYENDADDRDKWMTFFYDTFQTGPAGDVPIVNMWLAEKSNEDNLAMYGYESGVTYVVAYCAEDINGVVGPVKFASVTTSKPNPGPNPTVKFEDLEYDDESGEICGRIVCNDNAKMMKYFIVNSSNTGLYGDCALRELVDGSSDDRDYEAYMRLWEGQLMSLGLSSTAESVAISDSAQKNSNNPVLIAAIAIGENDGEDVYSPVCEAIFYKGEFKSLADFRTPPTE